MEFLKIIFDFLVNLIPDNISCYQRCSQFCLKPKNERTNTSTKAVSFTEVITYNRITLNGCPKYVETFMNSSSKLVLFSILI